MWQGLAPLPPQVQGTETGFWVRNRNRVNSTPKTLEERFWACSSAVTLCQPTHGVITLPPYLKVSNSCTSHNLQKLSPQEWLLMVGQRVPYISQTLSVLQRLLCAFAPTALSAQNPFHVLSSWQRLILPNTAQRSWSLRLSLSHPPTPKKQLVAPFNTLYIHLFLQQIFTEHLFCAR